MSVYVSIGNSDDKLTQEQWAGYTSRVFEIVRAYATAVHGQWYSASDSRWQNACICFDLGTTDEDEALLRRALATCARHYAQDSVAWAQAETEFIRP